MCRVSDNVDKSNQQSLRHKHKYVFITCFTLNNTWLHVLITENLYLYTNNLKWKTQHCSTGTLLSVRALIEGLFRVIMTNQNRQKKVLRDDVWCSRSGTISWCRVGSAGCCFMQSQCVSYCGSSHTPEGHTGSGLHTSMHAHIFGQPPKIAMKVSCY